MTINPSSFTEPFSSVFGSSANLWEDVFYSLLVSIHIPVFSGLQTKHEISHLEPFPGCCHVLSCGLIADRTHTSPQGEFREGIFQRSAGHETSAVVQPLGAPGHRHRSFGDSSGSFPPIFCLVSFPGFPLINEIKCVGRFLTYFRKWSVCFVICLFT